MTTPKTHDDIEKINEILDQEHLIETNEGTFGAEEACRKVGTGDPAFANYRIYKTLRGKLRHVGADKDEAPGRARRFPLPDQKAEIQRLAKTAHEEAKRVIRECDKRIPYGHSHLKAEKMEALTVLASLAKLPSRYRV